MGAGGTPSLSELMTPSPHPQQDALSLLSAACCERPAAPSLALAWFSEAREENAAGMTCGLTRWPRGLRAWAPVAASAWNGAQLCGSHAKERPGGAKPAPLGHEAPSRSGSLE